MANMDIYEHGRSVPDNAKKTIGAGRLKGMTDINPMWRIKVLTEMFGPCGVGWCAKIASKEVLPGSDGQMVAVVDVDLHIKTGDTWSEAICGTGGSMFVSNERNGAYTSDEAFKMAYTDAISVCCKMLGIGADVYWQGDRTKYTGGTEIEKSAPVVAVCDRCYQNITSVKKRDGSTWEVADMVAYSKRMYGKALCADCMKAAKKESDNG